MIGTYWAQPEGQRLISRHSVKERKGLDYESPPYNMYLSRYTRAQDPELVKKFNELRDLLKTGKKTSWYICRKLGIKSVCGYVENFKVQVALYCPDIWEDNNVWGLVDNAEEV